MSTERCIARFVPAVISTQMGKLSFPSGPPLGFPAAALKKTANNPHPEKMANHLRTLLEGTVRMGHVHHRCRQRFHGGCTKLLLLGVLAILPEQVLAGMNCPPTMIYAHTSMHKVLIYYKQYNVKYVLYICLFGFGGNFWETMKP